MTLILIFLKSDKCFEDIQLNLSKVYLKSHTHYEKEGFQLASKKNEVCKEATQGAYTDVYLFFCISNWGTNLIIKTFLINDLCFFQYPLFLIILS